MVPAIIAKRMYHLVVMKLESMTVIFVGSGRLASPPPNCAKTPTKTGTRKVTRAKRTMKAKLMMTVG